MTVEILLSTTFVLRYIFEMYAENEKKVLIKIKIKSELSGQNHLLKLNARYTMTRLSI